MIKKFLLLSGITFFFLQSLSASPFDRFIGEWHLIRGKSSTIELYQTLSLTISKKNDQTFRFIFLWGSGKNIHPDTIYINNNTNQFSWFIYDRVFPENVFLGVRMPSHTLVHGKVLTDSSNRKIDLIKSYILYTSQGKYPMKELNEFGLTNNDKILHLSISFSSRNDTNNYHFILKRKGYREAHVIRLSDNWDIQGDLDIQVMLLSIQGLVNRKQPELYFLYPDNWDYRFTGDFFDYLKDKKYFTFRQINSLPDVLKTYTNRFKGYIIWDKNNPSTMDLAFTLAGIRDGIVVSEDLIPLAEKAGLSLLVDLRSKYNNIEDYQLFNQAFEELGQECNRNMVVWLGGESGKIRKPGIADWGVMNKAFFTDLSTKTTDSAEYAISYKIMSSLNPLSIVYGWHVYTKDKERDFVKLASQCGLRVEGLHTLPNMSFMHHIPLEPGFHFHNNHTIRPDKQYKPEKKVYISCVQTDCLGLGAWNKPGRGQIPYAWEVTMNWSWLAPAMLEYFYSQATPNDYFIGSLSGPGYIYPKAVPDSILPAMIDSAWTLMKYLDLNAFEIMDYSEGSTIEGNTDLPEKIVDEYYDHMPGSIGFINGYAPAFTFTVKHKVPLISFDYYLSPDRSEKEVVADLLELARMNSRRPYFLLMHVRQWNDLEKVIHILDNLGKEFEVVPLDKFLRMAGQHPTFKNRFLGEQ